ncbi:hypothetical protein KI387_041643, partial [Taxus chinensis]
MDDRLHVFLQNSRNFVWLEEPVLIIYLIFLQWKLCSEEIILSGGGGSGCLIERKNQKGAWSDCKDCFDLSYREKYRWLISTNPLHFNIDQVLELKKGTIRIRVDIGGGTTTFTMRMHECNMMIVTTSMNLDRPFNNFIASRGMLLIFLTISQCLPFFDNTLDLIHSMHVLSNWIPTTLLDFVLYEIYRVLHQARIFWLDHFFCIKLQLDV